MTTISAGIKNPGEAGALALMLRCVAPLCSDVTQGAALRKGADAIIANLGGSVPDEAVTNLCGLLDAMFDTGLGPSGLTSHTEILEARAVAMTPVRGMFTPETSRVTGASEEGSGLFSVED